MKNNVHKNKNKKQHNRNNDFDRWDWTMVNHCNQIGNYQEGHVKAIVNKLH